MLSYFYEVNVNDKRCASFGVLKNPNFSTVGWLLGRPINNFPVRASRFSRSRSRSRSRSLSPFAYPVDQACVRAISCGDNWAIDAAAAVAAVYERCAGVRWSLRQAFVYPSPTTSTSMRTHLYPSCFAKPSPET
jgi:hypothetical protein